MKEELKSFIKKFGAAMLAVVMSTGMILGTGITALAEDSVPEITGIVDYYDYDTKDTNGMISWTPVEGAAFYELSFGGWGYVTKRTEGYYWPQSIWGKDYERYVEIGAFSEDGTMLAYTYKPRTEEFEPESDESMKVTEAYFKEGDGNTLYFKGIEDADYYFIEVRVDKTKLRTKDVPANGMISNHGLELLCMSNPIYNDEKNSDGEYSYNLDNEGFETRLSGYRAVYIGAVKGNKISGNSFDINDIPTISQDSAVEESDDAENVDIVDGAENLDIVDDAENADIVDDADDELIVNTASGENVTSNVATTNTTGVAIAATSEDSRIKAAASLPEDQYVQMIVENYVGESAQNLINNTAGASGAKVASMFEINLNACTSNGAVAGRVTELNAPIEMTVEAPADIDGNKYDFAMVRIHDGKADILPDIDSDPKTITFTTDKFSAYAVIYGEKGAFKAYASGQTGVKDSVPKTGDTLPIAIPVVAVFACAMAVVGMRKKTN